MAPDSSPQSARPLTKWLRLLTRPAAFFLLCGLGFGALFLVLTPPYQVADENAHAFRAWQIAQGKFHHGTIYDQIPVALESFADHKRLAFHQEQHIRPEALLQELRLGQTIDPAQTSLQRSTAFVYSPVPYLLSGLAMRLVYAFDLPAIWSVYLGRTFNLLAWAGLITLGIALLPALGWEMSFLALLPMSVFQGMSLSADALNNALAFLFLCLLMRVLLTEQASRRLLAALAVVTVLLATCKQVYALPFLLILFAKDRFSSPGAFWRYFLLTMACVGLTFLWPLCNAMPAHPKVQHDQAVRDLFKTALTPVIVVLRTLDTHAGRLWELYIGKLGWLDTSLPQGLHHAYSWTLAFVALVMCDVGRRVSPRLRKSALLIFLVVVSLTIMAMFTTCPRDDFYVAGGLQGRYFIPVMPLLLLALAKRRDSLSAFFERVVPVLNRLRPSRWYPLLLWAVTLVGLWNVALVLRRRYFF